ncbi:MAG TPA: TIGR02302 family protein [Thermohalobaculum sp.]|nr:TIGR02302 family protein [Thermohalobaculum sp.]
MAKFAFAGQRRALGKVTRRAIRLSRLALAAERLARALWPFFSALCLVLAAALLGGFSMLTPAVHPVAMAIAAALLAASLGWGLWRFRLPSRADAARRLDAADPGHPIATLGDSLAGGRDDRTAQALWFEHLRRAERAAARLKAAAPDLRLARYDRWALRLFAPSLLIAALIGAGEDWRTRLESLLAPARPAPEDTVTAAAGPAVEAWAIPPAYTGLDTVYLDRSATEPVRVPEGSELVLRVSDLAGAPELSAPGLERFDGFATLGDRLAEARGVLTGSGPVEVSDDGELLAAWQITVIPDSPPQISLPEPPGPTFAGALEVHYMARDDYGVTSAWAEITPMDGFAEGGGLVEEPVAFALPLPFTGRALEVADSVTRDFGEHPWAGAWVELTLHAEDGAGQRASAGPVGLRLPGRQFTHPLARSLVEQRRELAMDFEEGARALDVLQSVTRRPEAVFDDSYAAFLGTRVAIRRLADAVVADRVSKAAPDVAEYLWLAALSLEDGDLSSALERLRAAEEALRRALESGSDEDIRRAMEELRQAMNEYLQEMVRQALERGMDPADEQAPGGDQQMLSQQDLEEMLDELQRRAEAGLRDQAQDLLSELSRMLENLQAGRMQQGEGQQAMQELQELIQRQRDLADRTFDELRQQRRGGQRGQEGSEPSENGQQGQQPGDQLGEGQPGQQGRSGGLAGEQEALRRQLEELLGRIPGGADSRRSLGDAGRAMGEARDDLRAGRPDEAVPDQMEALDLLDDGMQALAEELQQGQGDVANQGRGRGEGRARDDQLDPFDRPAGAYGALDGRDTRVPDRSALDRAREVLEELRRRSAEPWRAPLELEYLDRLIDRF